MNNEKDVLRYTVQDPSIFWNCHLEDATTHEPKYTVFDPINRRIIEMKGSGGFPCEINTFPDENYIYQSTTESDLPWTVANTKSFKMFASKSWPGANGGVAWLPRYLNELEGEFVTGDSSYRAYSDCAAFVFKNLGGPILVRYKLLDSFNFSGDIGVLPDVLMQTYRWGGGLANEETNHYAVGFARLRWQLSTLINGIYVQKQTVLFNKIVPGGAPAPVFPCQLPVIGNG